MTGSVRVDFYQLSRDPAEAVVPLLASRALAAGARLLVVSADEGQIARISQGLWSRSDAFLAHGLIGGEDDARQPILLADRVEPANGATFLMLADGRWREGGQGDGQGFERTFYLFDDGTLKAARECWAALKGREGLTRHFWRQEGGRWTEAG